MAVKRRLMNFYGNLPRHESGPNQNRIDRQQVAELYAFTVQQVQKAYLSWQHIFRIEGSDLTFEQYLNKLKNNGLNPHDIGIKNNKYQLARYNDVGAYTNNSCRFVVGKVNRSEQKHRPKLMTEVKHGTPWVYLRYKCRCNLCKEAARESRRKYRKNKS